MAYKTETIIQLIAEGKVLPKQVVKEDLVRTIKSLLPQRLPEQPMVHENVDGEQLFTVRCRVLVCKNKARLPRSKAAGWVCANHK